MGGIGTDPMQHLVVLPPLPHSTVPTPQMATITQAEPVLGIKVMGTFSLNVPSFHHLFCPRGAQSWLPWQSGHSRHSLLLASLGTKHQKVSTLTRSEKYTSERMVKYWNRMHRVVVDTLNLEIFKASVDGALSNDTRGKSPCTLHRAGLDGIQRSLPIETILWFHDLLSSTSSPWERKKP